MISARTRQARSRLANAIKLGHGDVSQLRVAYDVERALDVIDTIRGVTSTEQRKRLTEAVRATADGDRA